MKNLRTIRILLAILFFVAAVAYLCIGPGMRHIVGVSERVQIIPSVIATCIGATAFWLLATFALGRVYCSTVCPIGTLQDIALRVRRHIPWMKPLRFRYKPALQIRYHIAAIYLICLILGLVGIPYLIEPWNIMRNIAASIRPSAVEMTWGTLWVGAATGIVAGIVSLLLILVSGFLFGRDFCNTVCPIGTGLGLLHQSNLMHIEINPDRCTGCLKCEEICRASCIKVTGRLVDNSRCVRCFDCIKVCDEEAIRLQSNRNRAATPLLRRKART